MTDIANALEVLVQLDDIEVTVVRHDSIEEMLADLKEEYADCAKSVHGMDVFPDDIGALTVGDIVDGKSMLIIYIPYGHPDDKYAEIVAHEAVHAAFALHRHKINGKIDDFTPLPIAVDGRNDSVNEESIANSVGHMTSLIWEAMHSINEHKSFLEE